MIKKIGVMVIILLVGICIGSFNSPKIEIIKKVKVEVPYLDLTAPDLKHRLEVVAKAIHLTVHDRQEIEDLHKRNKQELEDIKRKNKQELEDLYRQKEYSFLQKEYGKTEQRSEYSRGYEMGYQDAMQKGD